MSNFRKIPFALLLLFEIVIIMLFLCNNNTDNPDFINQKSVYKIQILEIPKISNQYVNFKANIICSVNDSDKITYINEKTYCNIFNDTLSSQLKQGDILLVVGKPQHSYKQNPNEFNFDKYLYYNRNITSTLYIHKNQWKLLKHKTLYDISSIAERCQNKLINIFINYDITGDELGVLSALTLGERDYLNPNIRKSYSDAGAMHILAVSGLHVGIVYTAIFLILTLFNYYPESYKNKKRKVFNAVVIIIFLWIYAFITGLSPSVVRSSLMLTLYTIARATFQNKSNWNIIFASAFIILFINYKSLFTVSFQLSYAAVCSITLFNGYISNIFNFKNKIIRWIWQILSISIAAQIGTIPLSLYYFYQTSNYFAITNLIVIPASSIILYTAIITLIFSWSHLGFIFSYLLNKEIFLLNKIVRIIENLPYATTNFSINIYQLILLYLIIISIGIYVNNYKTNNYNKIKILSFPFLLSILFIGVNFEKLNKINHTKQIIIFNEYDNITILGQNGRTCKIISDDINKSTRTTQNYVKFNMIKNNEYIDISQNPYYELEFLNKKFLILRDSAFYKVHSKHKLRYDYILYSSNKYSNIEKIMTNCETDTVVIMPNVKPWNEQKIIQKLEDMNIPYIDQKSSTIIK